MRNRRQIRRKKSNFKKILIGILVIGGFIVYTGYSHITNPIAPDNTETTLFEIQAGENGKQIASNLETSNFIKSDTIFYGYLRYKKAGPKIVAGKFQLSPSMNMPEILETITNPITTEQVSFTIQEGLTIKEIDAKLTKSGLITPGEFTTAVKNYNNPYITQEVEDKLEFPLEGYIYPDTYFLDPQESIVTQLITKGLENFELKTTEIVGEINNYSLHEIITMASIIENEVFGAEDRHLVSGILWKRYENNWFIGADITVVYATGNRDITYEDLQIDSPYNTRKRLGLPPGPVGNPSLESIESAIYPKESEYWYYLTTLDTGEVIYSRNESEHNFNKTKYL